MEAEYHTYLDFLLHTKSIIYILIVASLIGMAYFWNFLTGKEKDDNGHDI